MRKAMITAIVLTNDEEQNIGRCLKSLLWCDEILVVDDYSEDDTISIAKQYGAKIYKRNLANNFAEQRNFGLEKASHDWVLFVDADEVVPFSLQDEILVVVADTNKNAFFLQRRDILWGRTMKHGESGSVQLIRLARKNAGKWKGKVHERWVINGQVGRFQSGLIHYPHQSIGQFISDVNYYTDLRAEELFYQKKQVFTWEIILYPKFKFIQNYFVKVGFLDGFPGFMTAIIMSFHSFLVRAKLWLLWQEER